MQSVILLFAKAPVPGQVKTRLAPVLDAESAAALQTAFVRDVLQYLEQIPNVDVELHTDIHTDAFAVCGVTQRVQVDGDLQLKMLHSLSEAFARGYKQILILGSDSPTLPVTHIKTLLASAVDVALGPAEDGGFYAISCRRMHPQMFSRVEWSCADTLEQTIAAVRRCGLTVEIGLQWYDVDTPEDLARLMRELELPPCTAKWMRAYFNSAWTSTS